MGGTVWVTHAFEGVVSGEASGFKFCAKSHMQIIHSSEPLMKETRGFWEDLFSVIDQ